MSDISESLRQTLEEMGLGADEIGKLIRDRAIFIPPERSQGMLETHFQRSGWRIDEYETDTLCSLSLDEEDILDTVRKSLGYGLFDDEGKFHLYNHNRDPRLVAMMPEREQGRLIVYLSMDRKRVEFYDLNRDPMMHL